MPSSYLILCHPLFLLPPVPPSIKLFSNESTLRIRWPKYWSFSLSMSFQRTPRADLLQNGLGGSPCSPRDSQESSPTPWFRSICSLALSIVYHEKHQQTKGGCWNEKWTWNGVGWAQLVCFQSQWERGRTLASYCQQPGSGGF